MDALYLTIPLATILALIFLGLFFWSVKTKQYDDPDYIAQKNFEPVMDQRYYEKGLNYEQRKHEFEKSKEKNWQASINILDRDSIKKDFLLEVRLNNSNLKDFFSDPERNVVDLKISYPATMKGSYEFQFVEKEFKVKNNYIVLEKQLQIQIGRASCRERV